MFVSLFRSRAVVALIAASATFSSGSATVPESEAIWLTEKSETTFAVRPAQAVSRRMDPGFLTDRPVTEAEAKALGFDLSKHRDKGATFDLEAGSILLRQPGGENQSANTLPVINNISAGQSVRPQIYYDVDNFVSTFRHFVSISVNGQVVCEGDIDVSSGGLRTATCPAVVISSGRTVVDAEIDARNTNIEADEGNNIRSRTYDTNQRTDIDFIADSVVLTSDSSGNSVVTNPQPGQQLFPRFRFDVDADINYYWRAEMRLGDGTRLCGFVFTFPDPDGSFWDIGCANPITVPNGEFLLIGEVDYLFEQSESNENNNVSIARFGATSMPTQVIIDFEGLQNTEPVQTYYAGGMGGFGSSGGTNFGVDFGPDALAIIDEDAGGTGNFGGEPSPDTALFFLEGSAIMNVPGGFDAGFSFFYSAVNEAGEVVVYDGVDATGNVLARVNLPITDSDGGDPTGAFSPFFPAGVSFSGIARSVDFSGGQNRIAFDNITFGTATPGGDATIGINQVTPDACPDVQAVVSVVDSSGFPVTGLTSSNFDVVDNSQPVSSTVQTVGSSGSDAQIALVFDTSGSMGGQAIADARDASQAFVNLLGSQDQVALYSFATAVTRQVNYTTNKNTVNNAIAGLNAGGQTAFYDALIQAANEIAPRSGRKAIVAFTDGQDTASANSLDTAIAAANAAGVPVFAVGFGAAESGVLSQISSSTGGIFFNGGLDTASLNQLLTNIGQILNNQYLVTWSPDLSQGGTHTAVITVTTAQATSRDTVTYDSSICGAANQAPNASFAVDVVANSLTANFTDTSTDSDGSIVRRSWTFGDGTSSTQRNPSHTYPAAGTYNVMLTVTDDGGATATASALVTLSAVGLTAPMSIPTPANIGANDRFGTAVSGAGNAFAVGAPSDDLDGTDAGSVVTFTTVNGMAVSDGTLDIPSGFVTSGFGASLAQQGNFLVVGAPGAMTSSQKGGLSQLQAALFERAQQAFGFKAPLPAPSNVQMNDEFGAAVAIDGGTALVGAPGTNNNRGAAYLYDFDGSNFTMIARMDPPSGAPAGMRFGQAVAASNGKFAIGAPGGPIGNALMGSVALFDQIGNNIRDRGTVTGAGSDTGDAFGTSVAMEGNTLLVGSPGNDAEGTNSGAAYMFNFLANSVQEQGRIAASDPTNNAMFGSDVSLAGGNIVVGAPGAMSGGSPIGAAYAYRVGGTNVFKNTNLHAKGGGAPVTFVQKLDAPNNQSGFGSAVEAAGTEVFIGAPDTGPDSGAVSLSTGLRTASRVVKPILAVDPSRGCPGFYIARVEGLNDTGRWSMEILLEPGVSPFLQGGLNLGGGFGPVTSPGFAAFNIANRANESQIVTIDVDVTKASGTSYRVEIINRTGGANDVVFATDSSAATLTVERTLAPGFYSMRIYSVGAAAGSDRGIFTMSMLTRFTDRAGGAFQGGVNLGGIIENDTIRDTNEGFAAVCIDTQQEVRFTTFGDDAFGGQGIGNLGLRVLDRDRNPVVADPGN